MLFRNHFPAIKVVGETLGQITSRFSSTVAEYVIYLLVDTLPHFSYQLVISIPYLSIRIRNAYTRVNFPQDVQVAIFIFAKDPSSEQFQRLQFYIVL